MHLLWLLFEFRQGANELFFMGGFISELATGHEKMQTSHIGKIDRKSSIRQSKNQIAIDFLNSIIAFLCVSALPDPLNK